MPRIGAIERFIAEREIGDDVAVDRNFKERPLEPRRVAQVAAADAAAVDPDPDQYVAAETFGKGQSFAAGLVDRGGDRPRWQTLDKLVDQRQTLLDFADADPDAGVDVALVQHRHVKINAIIGWISRRFARIESAATGAPHISAGCELSYQAAMHDA